MRSGSCRLCDATYANCCRSAFERVRSCSTSSARGLSKPCAMALPALETHRRPRCPCPLCVPRRRRGRTRHGRCDHPRPSGWARSRRATQRLRARPRLEGEGGARASAPVASGHCDRSLRVSAAPPSSSSSTVASEAPSSGCSTSRLATPSSADARWLSNTSWPCASCTVMPSGRLASSATARLPFSRPLCGGPSDASSNSGVASGSCGWRSTAARTTWVPRVG